MSLVCSKNKTIGLPRLLKGTVHQKSKAHSEKNNLFGKVFPQVFYRIQILAMAGTLKDIQSVVCKIVCTLEEMFFKDLPAFGSIPYPHPFFHTSLALLNLTVFLNITISWSPPCFWDLVTEFSLITSSGRNLCDYAVMKPTVVSFRNGFISLPNAVWSQKSKEISLN